jgi:hypothetical protein
MKEAVNHSIRLFSTSRGVGMEIRPPLTDIQQKLMLGSSKLTDQLRSVLVREPGKMFHADEMSGWGILSNTVTRPNDNRRIRSIANQIVVILDGYGYTFETVDMLDGAGL